MLDDAKVGRLSDRLFRRMIQLFLLAGETNRAGYLPSMSDMAWRLRIDEEILETEMNDLAKVGILTLDKGEWLVTNFALRQAAMSNSERAKRWREKNAGVQWAKNLYKGLPAKPGIYQLTCKRTGMHYVGASNNIHTRIKQHLYKISKDEHPMSEDVLDYGVETLAVKVLEIVDDENILRDREQHWLDQYPKDDLYNSQSSKRHQNWSETYEERLENEYQTNRSQIEEVDKDKEEDEEYTPTTDYSKLSVAFCNMTGIPELTGGAIKWNQAIKFMVENGITVEDMETAYDEVREQYHIVGPWSIKNPALIAMSRRKKKSPTLKDKLEREGYEHRRADSTIQ